MAQPTEARLTRQLEQPETTLGNVGHAGSGTQPENGPHDENHEDDHTHHVSMATYYAVFAFLIFMLFMTVGAWYVDQHLYSLGRFSTPVAMAIAVAKAVAIVLIFMHVKFFQPSGADFRLHRHRFRGHHVFAHLQRLRDARLDAHRWPVTSQNSKRRDFFGNRAVFGVCGISETWR